MFLRADGRLAPGLRHYDCILTWRIYWPGGSRGLDGSYERDAYVVGFSFVVVSNAKPYGPL
jgi:hypothetical protein